MTVIPSAGDFEKRRPVALGHVRPGDDARPLPAQCGGFLVPFLVIFAVIGGSTAAGIGISILGDYLVKTYG